MIFKKSLSLFFLLFVGSLVSLAQPGGGDDPGPGTPVPLTGVELLLLAGAGLGAKRVISKRRRRKTER